MEFSKKTIVVSGAASPVGKAICTAFAKAGGAIAACDKNLVGRFSPCRSAESDAGKVPDSGWSLGGLQQALAGQSGSAALGIAYLYGTGQSG